jgi:hypothetical protein
MGVYELKVFLKVRELMELLKGLKLEIDYGLAGITGWKKVVAYPVACAFAVAALIFAAAGLLDSKIEIGKGKDNDERDG